VDWLTVAFLWIAAAFFLVRMPKTATLPGVEIKSDVRCDIQ
jgi:hypothetical protein